MPKKGTYTAKQKKALYARMRKKYTSMGTPSGFPTSQRTKSRYSTSKLLTSTTGTLGSTVFRCNSIYDPDYTSTGHSAFMFDQMSAIYNHYVVVSATINIRVVPQGDSIEPFVSGVYLTDTATVPYTGYNEFIEAKKGTTRVMSGGVGGKSGNYKTSFNAKKFFNITDIRDVSRIGGLSNGNPTEEAYFVVWAQTLNATASDAWVHMITIDYVIEWSEPKDVPQS